MFSWHIKDLSSTFLSVTKYVLLKAVGIFHIFNDMLTDISDSVCLLLLVSVFLSASYL